MAFDPKRWLETISGAGAVILSLLSCAACPLCIPLYTGSLSLLGFEICRDNDVLLPFITILFLITISLMAYHSYRHKVGYLPLGVAVLFAALAAVSMIYDWDYLLYSNLALLSVSIFWHKRPLRHHDHEEGHEHHH